MYGHLVTVEVSVKRLTNEGVNLNGLTINKYGLEGLDTQTVQGRSTVKQYRVLTNNLFENVPDESLAALDHTLSALDVGGNLSLDQTLHNERLEELESHHLG